MNVRELEVCLDISIEVLFALRGRGVALRTPGGDYKKIVARVTVRKDVLLRAYLRYLSHIRF